MVGCDANESQRFDAVIRNGTVFDGTGALRDDATAESYEVVFDVSQEANQPASGTLELYDRTSKKRLLQARELGLLQATKGWGSITATASRYDGTAVGLLLIVDSADPTAGTGHTTVVMEVDGLPRLTGQLDSTAVILEAGT